MVRIWQNEIKHWEFTQSQISPTRPKSALKSRRKCLRQKVQAKSELVENNIKAPSISWMGLLQYHYPMTTYVALLRGIMPTNPNMKSEKLKAVFESLGFKNVATVIASGNVVFDSPSTNVAALETKIEKELPLQLGFNSSTIIRSREEIEKLVKKNPFKNIKDEKPNYLVVTFFKDRQKDLCTTLTIDDKGLVTTSYMSGLEKKHGKAITTRTWKTVGRILKKMENR